MDSPLETNREGGVRKRKAKGLLHQKVSGASRALSSAPPFRRGVRSRRGEGVVAGAEARRPEFSGMNLELLGKEGYGCGLETNPLVLEERERAGGVSGCSPRYLVVLRGTGRP